MLTKRACEPKIQVKVKFIKINKKRHPPPKKKKVKTSTYEIGTSAFQQFGFTDETLTKLIHHSPEASPCQMFQIQSAWFPSAYDDHLPSSPGCLPIPWSCLWIVRRPAQVLLLQVVVQVLLVGESLGTEITLDIPHCWSRPVLTCFLMGGKVFLLIEDLVTKVTFDMVLAIMSFCMTI